MKIELPNHNTFLHVTDNSNECDASSIFVLTKLNAMYEQSARDHGCTHIISPKACLDLLGIRDAIKIIGITGTNGKTTTAAAIYSILLDLGKKVGLQGTRGCFINDHRIEEKSLTTPPILQTIHNLKLAVDAGCEYFVMEVSSHAIVQNRIDGLPFALKILTNVTQDHLDFHKTIDEYIAVKSRFFDDESVKLINKDESKIRFNRTNAMTYGIEHPATYKILAYSLKEGISAAVAKIDKVYEFESPLHGFFNLYNILAAISAVDMLGVASMEAICEAVEHFGGVEGRMEVVSHDPLVIVDFAHTPDGMEKVLDSMKERDLVVVFGAGGDRDRTKRPKMGAMAQRYAKKIVVTSDNPRSEDPHSIIAEILTGMSPSESLHVEVDRHKAIEKALRMQASDEVLLILGKGDETYQEIQGKKYPFDDRSVVRELIAQWAKQK
ncbi:MULTISPECIES: UDP-N-acetylmuramoyl-L-alanyl-D-glutamate--2,6-diaminopimelate ligase [unclassified Sulfurospirillum]|uniref:UDP-N-acetylmuramoyl-L-alanyl-D-glutamate--2, 6-diaminopimelate ligase n=1 Tax=unclassified Sulfurospirillum TaxID=2618290 RepID=UPI0005003069|nr:MULTISPECIES: UDP-N-acetylmuramoyl-L-alanyl-D-glutamate--2,6-diaminopimelate ligase [unclassified Sulfurospirillum]KFL33499.1 UDP-N-acetylmuramoylalanyl-D-glutamate--2,6-diaminopimelate ligase [Sulfurospirillum sp. SCADC]